MNGTIERIRIFPAKGEAGKDLSEGRLIENKGLEGDFHTKGSDPLKPETRQISLRFTGSSGPDNGETEKGLCIIRFKENITINCPDKDRTPFLSPGTRFSVGDAVLEISGETKRCHEECSLYKTGERCSLAGLNLFAKVIKGGIIHLGEQIGENII